MNEQEKVLHDKQYFFGKARTYLILNSVFGIIAIIFGIILMFYPKLLIIGEMVIILAVAWIFVTFFRYYVKSEEDLEIVIATCVDRRRVGYRKQYFEYTFVVANSDEENEGETRSSFEMKSATKEKFKKDITYRICFKKSKVESPAKYSSNLICWEVY